MHTRVARNGLIWWVKATVTDSIAAAAIRDHLRPALLRSSAMVATVTNARPTTWGA